MKTIPKIAPQKCALWPILSFARLVIYAEYIKYNTPKIAEGIPIGIKKREIFPPGERIMLEKTIAETAP